MFRKFRLEDSANITALLNDVDVSRWTTHIPYPYTETDAILWLEKQENTHRKPLAIELDHKLVGCISYWSLNPFTTEIGYWIGKPFWGKGIATAALTNLLSSPNFPKTTKVVARVAARNIGSRRVLEKCGFEVREQYQVEKSGQITDILFYITSNV